MKTDFKHIHFATDSAGNGVLTIDSQGASMNVLSRDLVLELEDAFTELQSEKLPGLIIRSAKRNCFIAGADINEFTTFASVDVAKEAIQRGQGIMQRIQDLPYPTVAAIHGVCLGGGLELALACTYRVATDESGTILGLPEVMLGIHPGFGGSVRSIQKIGVFSAMDIMLSGRTLSPYQGKKMGLVDRITPVRHLENEARKLLSRKPRPTRPPFIQRLVNRFPFRGVVASILRKKVASRARAEHYPAPYGLIRVWEKYGGNFRRMMDREAESVARLMMEPSTQNLIRVFFLREKLKSRGKKAKTKLEKIHVVGAGTMGGDIASYSAYKNLRVTIQDQGMERIAPAIRKAHSFFRKKLRKDRDVESRMDNLIPDPDGTGIRSSDLLIEAVFEDLQVKRDIFGKAESHAKNGTILATNTSSIPIDLIAEGLKHPENLVGIHFFNPVAKMPLIEVVVGQKTGQEAIDRAFAYAGQIGKLPLPVKSSPGFLVNRVLMSYLQEAFILEEEGVPISEIDKIATDFGMPMGPLFLADTIGLDVCLHVAKVFQEDFNQKIPENLPELVNQGKLGKKSGSGFYDHKKKKAEPTRSGNKRIHPGEIEDRLILSFLNTAVTCLREGVVEDTDDLDAGMIFGTGFAPFRGGPIHYAIQTGIDTIINKLSVLEQSFPDRFTVDPGWMELKSGGGK